MPERSATGAAEPASTRIPWSRSRLHQAELPEPAEEAQLGGREAREDRRASRSFQEGPPAVRDLDHGERLLGDQERALALAQNTHARNQLAVETDPHGRQCRTG